MKNYTCHLMNNDYNLMFNIKNVLTNIKPRAIVLIVYRIDNYLYLYFGGNTI